MMQDDVRRLAEESGELRSVSGLATSGGRFTMLRFEFEAGALVFRCNDDTDEVVASIGDDASSLPEIQSGVLTGCLGLVIESAWELRNHRGYLDGFQLRLRNAHSHEDTLQLEVAASAITIYRVEPGSHLRLEP